MIRKLKIGYFADGPWSHLAFEKLIEDDSIEIKFIVPSKFLRDWIVREYKENILNDLRKIDSKFKDIKNIEILSEI